MARNIELKAHARAFDDLRERAAALADDTPLILRQQDFFYDVPKASYYTRSPVTNPDAMHALLATAFATRGIVTKERHVYLAGRTRIHLDRVDGLGDFVELEVVLQPDDDEESGATEAHALFAKPGVAQTDLVAVAYVDLLNDIGTARAA